MSEPKPPLGNENHLGGNVYHYRRTSVEEILLEYGFPVDGEHTVEIIPNGGDQEIRLYQDGCQADSPPEHRPGFCQMLEDIKSSPVPIAAIEIENVSRLSRTPEIINQMIAMAEKAGVPIRIKDDESRRLMAMMRKRFSNLTYHDKST